MLTKRLTLFALAVAGIALTGCQIGPRTKGPSLGYLEHRGQPYELRDLMDPRYRIESSDRFAREFDPQLHFAGDLNGSSLTPWTAHEAR
jgi:hypothetical protein